MQVIPKQRKPPARMHMDPFGAFSPLGMFGGGMGPPGMPYGGGYQGRGGSDQKGRGGRGYGGRGTGGRGRYGGRGTGPPAYVAPDVWIRGIHELEFTEGMVQNGAGSMVN